MKNSLRVRNVLGIIIASFCLLLAGCQSESVDEKENIPLNEKELEKIDEKPSTNEEETPAKEDESPTVDKEPSKVDKETTSYKLNKTTYQNGNIIVYYPQITDLENNTKVEEINDLLRLEIMHFIDQYEDENTSLELNYQVTKNTLEMLSVVYTGYYSVKGGMYPSHFLFTSNIDLKTGAKINISDLTTIDESFIEKIQNATYIDWENPASTNEEKAKAAKDYIKGINHTELINAFKMADLPSAKSNLYGIFSYFENDDLIISIQVPHVLGDHAEYKMKLD